MSRFASLFSEKQESADNLRQEQREAILDALHYCMYADNRIVFAEDSVIAGWASKLSWDSGTPFAEYAARSVSDVRRAKEEPGFRERFVAGIGARLADDATRGLAMRLCKQLVAADGTATEAELKVIADLKLDNHVF